MYWFFKNLLAIGAAILAIYGTYIMVRCTLDQTGCVEHKSNYFLTVYSLEDPFDFLK